ncbi:MAG TPA: hypothetical protein DD379_12085 [Cyanobacteria bacterium UBA11162]|nr:hypothetical protein [Cyanobacteria bacterium UBA11370]HBL12124.1 hypothetical protein [Cyanobacteria bacterium UBA11162]HBY78350.1 hypothetical protein [Cyanobacteria bacterium UBA11148]
MVKLYTLIAITVFALIVLLYPSPSPSQVQCDRAYPGVCIPSPPPDLDCKDIQYRNFTVLPPDPHNFDGGGDGIGCEQH